MLVQSRIQKRTKQAETAISIFLSLSVYIYICEQRQQTQGILTGLLTGVI